MLALAERRAILQKIAAEQAAAKKPSRNDPIYSPGVVAHEAGHAWMHRQPEKPGEEKFDITGTAEMVGGLLPLGVLAGKLLTGKGPPSAREMYGAMALGFTPRLVDEYSSSFKGHGALKGSKAFKKPLTDEEVRQERNKLIAAGSTYAAVPLAFLSQGEMQQRKDPRWMLGALGAIGIQLGGLAYAAKAKGPKVNAQEAKALAQEIAPGVPVYATTGTFAGGSAYLPPVKNRVMRALMNHQLKPYFDEKERTKIINEGGIMIAPMSGKNLSEALMSSIGGGGGGLDDRFKEVK